MSQVSRRQAMLLAAQLGLVTVVTPRAVLAQGGSPKQTERVTIVLVNDLDRMADFNGRGGHAKLAAVAKTERAKGRTLLIHAGDAYSPSILSGFDRGHHIVELLNQIKPDTFTPGNHEFDFGAENFRARIKQSTFDILAANIFEPDGKRVAGLQPTRIIDVGPVKIGFVGVCTEETKDLSDPGPIQFQPAVKTVIEQADRLRSDGVHLVVAVTHIGFGDDLLLARSGAVDVILSGHDHHLLTYWDGKVALVESASQADFVTPIDLMIDSATLAPGKRASFIPHFRPIDTSDIAPDPALAASIAGYMQALDKDLDVVIGSAGIAFTTRSVTMRSGENGFANFVCDAMRKAVSADICLINGGGIRANSDYAAGASLTRRSILEEMPFGNKTVLLEIDGATLHAALEHGLHGGGGFPQVSGLVLEADPARPLGQRVLSIDVNGKPLAREGRYTLATNDFVARGGDGYVMFKSARTLIDGLAGQYVSGQVIAHIAKLGTIEPKIEGRIKLK